MSVCLHLRELIWFFSKYIGIANFYTDFLLVGKDSAVKKFKDAKDRSIVIATLHRLQKLLMGQISFGALNSIPTMTSVEVEGTSYHPAGMISPKVTQQE